MITTLVFLVFAPCITAQDWTVPPDRRARLSPFGFTDENRASGENLFGINCISCHGNPGRNNWLRDLEPQPGDITSEKYQQNSDGELFYKLNEGRGPMPGFRNVLSQTEIWELVAYIRSFNPDYRQVIAPARSGDVPDYSYIVLEFMTGGSDGELSVKATGYVDEKPQPVKGAEMQLTVSRTFGKLIIDENKETDERGEVKFLVPATLKGDPEGKLSLTARLTEEDLYGIAAADTLLSMGEAVVPVSLTEKRAMWNTVRKAPIWLIVTFTLAFMGVAATILYVLLAIRDIWIIGGMDNEPTNKNTEI
jgi:hypothetical protein